MGGTGRPLGKTFFLHRQRRHPELPKIPTYLPTYLPARHRIYVMGGVIDNYYRVNLGVILANFGSTDFSVLPGARIAQMIVLPTTPFSTVVAESLPPTDRSTSGFGSTGIRNVYASPSEAPVRIPPRSLTIGTQDIRQIVTSDVCTCTGIRCSCRAGQEAWSAFNSLRPEDILTDAHSCTLPFQARQHGKVLSRYAMFWCQPRFITNIITVMRTSTLVFSRKLNLVMKVEIHKHLCIYRSLLRTVQRMS